MPSLSAPRRIYSAGPHRLRDRAGANHPQSGHRRVPISEGEPFVTTLREWHKQTTYWTFDYAGPSALTAGAASRECPPIASPHIYAEWN